MYVNKILKNTTTVFYTSIENIFAIVAVSLTIEEHKGIVTIQVHPSLVIKPIKTEV